MPKKDNLLSPLTLIGNGRSGTSLVLKMFEKREDTFVVGETANMIHSVWDSLSRSLPSCRIPDAEKTHKQIYQQSVRSTFLRAFNTEHDFWFQKPIGVPSVRAFYKNDEEFITWYWETFKAVFPKAKCFSVIRHPLDVLVSSYSYWGRDYTQMTKSHTTMAKILTHKDSMVDYVLVYEKLLANPEKEVRKLCDYLEIPYSASMLEAMKRVHVPKIGADVQEVEQISKERKGKQFSHSERWSEVPDTALTQELIDATEGVWAKYNLDYDWKKPLVVDV
jgi:hypothetical protein